MRKVYKIKESQKSVIKCPFEIRYSLLAKVVADKVPDICHEIKITYTNFEHTCELSPVYLREAKRRGGFLKLDIPALKSALDLLRLHQLSPVIFCNNLVNRYPGMILQHVCLSYQIWSTTNGLLWNLLQ